MVFKHIKNIQLHSEYMQIKIGLKYNFSPIRLATIQKLDNMLFEDAGGTTPWREIQHT